LKTREFKDDCSRAYTVAERIRVFPGVTGASANPVTGSLVVTYNASGVQEAVLIEHIAAVLGGPIKRSAKGNVIAVPPEILQQVARTMAKAAMEAALKRAILALV
jgi:hypothetical protein